MPVDFRRQHLTKGLDCIEDARKIGGPDAYLLFPDLDYIAFGRDGWFFAENYPVIGVTGPHFALFAASRGEVRNKFLNCGNCLGIIQPGDADRGSRYLENPAFHLY